MTLSPTGQVLRDALDGPFHAVKQRWRDEVAADDFVRDPVLGVDEARDWALDRLTRLARRGFAVAGFPAEYGGRGDQAESVAHFEMLALGDLSLAIKSGVQHGLWGGAIVNLGTEFHHATFLPDTIPVALAGCFAMTEIGHGSDVQSLQTTITYLPDTAEFEVAGGSAWAVGPPRRPGRRSRSRRGTRCSAGSSACRGWARRSCCSTTSPINASSCPTSPAPTRSGSPRTSSRCNSSG